MQKPSDRLVVGLHSRHIIRHMATLPPLANFPSCSCSCYILSNIQARVLILQGKLQVKLREILK